MKPHLLLFGFLLATVSMQAKNYNSPYGFYENKGQIIDQNNNLNPSVKYLWTGNGMKVQLKRNSFSYEVLKVEKFEYRNPKHKVMLSLSKHRKAAFDDSTVIYSHRVDIELLNSNPHPQIIAEEKSADYDNYYTTGTPEEGVTFVYHYSKVTYKDIYPNIDLEFVSDAKNEKGFKYNFIIRPGGDLSKIKIRYSGALNVNLVEKNIISINTLYGNIIEEIPNSFEVETGKQVFVSYSHIGNNTFQILSPLYNLENTLVIDPLLTYYGGSNNEGCTDVCSDEKGNIIFTGSTASINNIASTGAYQTTLHGNNDAFIVKFSPNGTKLWSTYFGGDNNDAGSCICLDTSSNMFIGGITYSANNIATTGGYQTVFTGDEDGFIAKFNSSGIRQWSSYYGGDSSIIIQSISIDNNCNVYAAGYTTSANGVATIGSHQQIYSGFSDAFIVKFTYSGNRLWGTYYGGNNYDDSHKICIDVNGNILIAGTTSSVNNIATVNAFQQIYSGTTNAFVSKFDANGILIWGTYYGNVAEEGFSVTCDNNNNVFLFGETSSSIGIATVGAYQTVINNGSDAFIVKFNPNGGRLWGTYFGGDVGEWALDIQSDAINNIIITGYTSSTIGIASPNAFQTILKGVNDAYLAKFSANGNRLWSTYFGGNNEDVFQGIAIRYNSIIAVGATSSDTGLIPSNAFQATYGGGLNDALIVCFDSTGHLIPDGISNLNQQTESLINVYPNPANDKITVSIKEYTVKGGSLVLMDVEGKVVKSVVVKSAECSIDVKDLAAGVYLLQYEDGEVCETVKFVKE